MKAAYYAVLLALVLGVGCGDDTPTEFTHTCVFCKEEVKVGAIKCKHCGEHPYAGQSPFQEGMEKAANETLAKHRDKGWPWWKWPIAGVLVMIIMSALTDEKEGTKVKLMCAFPFVLILWLIW